MKIFSALYFPINLSNYSVANFNENLLQRFTLWSILHQHLAASPILAASNYILRFMSYSFIHMLRIKAYVSICLYPNFFIWVSTRQLYLFIFFSSIGVITEAGARSYISHLIPIYSPSPHHFTARFDNERRGCTES